MSEWNEKGATLSDKTACKEFGLTQDEIIKAVREKKLQYKENHIHGNPYLRLLREEVESLVINKYGNKYFKERTRENEIACINKEIRSLKIQLAKLEKKKAILLKHV
jgi:DNA mismatch repair ATPase MutS